MAAFNGCFGSVGEHIKEEVAHLIAYADNLENLKKQVQNLSAGIKSVGDRIEETRNNLGATIVNPVVDRLLERMASLKEEASKIIAEDERSSDSTCLMGLRTNLWACYLTSKAAKRAIDKATELLEKEKKFDGPVAHVPFSRLVIPISDFEEFESRVIVSSQIMAALKDPNVNIVGVHGMGGTGKTTLVEKIGAELQLNGTFNFVFLVTVSEQQSLFQSNYQPDLLYIQTQISEQSKIRLHGQTLRDRAAELHEKLLKKDKVLIILDDIWSKFELEKVGIPFGSRLTMKFKILMTSRSKMVLENGMDSTNNFRLDSLPTDDAQKLFNKKVGGDSQYSNWPLTAQRVIDQCRGIPLLLVIIGRALRNENQSVWEQCDSEYILDLASNMIKVNYNFLKNEEIQKLFLLCAQLDHHSIAINDLVKYVMGLNLFKGCKKVKEVTGKLHKYLRDLKGCCLLQDGDEEGIMKMHDFVRKFASFVALRDHHVFSVANDGELKEWPSKDDFEHFSAISLPYCHLPPDHMFPTTFDNSMLESFLMLRSEIDVSFNIPENFFVGMKELKLMSLKRMSLSSVLVSSLSALVKLRTLCLDHCKLSDINVIGELPVLQALSLVGSSIVLVPKEMGKLGGTLKLLDLRDCCELEIIASGVISKLTLLEDLRIGASFMRWERLGGRDKSSDNVDETYEAEVASLEEFKNLRKLIHLEIHVPDHTNMFPKDLVFKKLETFKIHIGNQCWSSDDYIEMRTLEISESSTKVVIDSEGIKALMARAERLWLAGLTSSVSVTEMDPEGFPELRHLKVDSGDRIQYIAKKNYSNCVFPKLETLDLCFLDKLERICDDDVLPVGSFENLRVLELNDLPCLVSFCSFNQIERLPSPTLLFNKKILFPKLEVLRMSKIKVEKIWKDESPISAGRTCWLQNLTTLSVDGCNNLSYLFTSSMVESLAQLKDLAVYNCESIEEIVASTDTETVGDIQLPFPRLHSLKLECLPNLHRFCQTNVLECQLLRKLVIRSCSKLKTFVAFCYLEELEINGSGSFKMIWGNQLHPKNLSRLKVLAIDECREEP